jgi:hypothetical protein
MLVRKARSGKGKGKGEGKGKGKGKGVQARANASGVVTGACNLGRGKKPPPSARPVLGILSFVIAGSSLRFFERSRR